MVHAPAQQARAESKNPALFLQSRGRDVTWFGEATAAQEFFVVEISEETKRSHAPSSPSRAGRAPRAAGAPRSGPRPHSMEGKETRGSRRREKKESEKMTKRERVRATKLFEVLFRINSPLFLRLSSTCAVTRLSSLPFLFLSNRPPRKWPRRRSSPTAPGLHSHPRTGKAAPPPRR